MYDENLPMAAMQHMPGRLVIEYIVRGSDILSTEKKKRKKAKEMVK